VLGLLLGTRIYVQGILLRLYRHPINFYQHPFEQHEVPTHISSIILSVISTRNISFQLQACIPKALLSSSPFMVAVPSLRSQLLAKQTQLLVLQKINARHEAWNSNLPKQEKYGYLCAVPTLKLVQPLHLLLQPKSIASRTR